MDQKKFLDDNGLLYYDQKIKKRLENKVDKEHKTNSESEYKVLSDNNLTDELVKKINSAGSNDYENLTNKPAIDGNELSSSSTAEELGLAKKEDIPSDYVSTKTLEAKGYQTADDVNGILDGKNYATENFVTEKGYQTSTDVSGSINAAFSSKTTISNYGITDAYTKKEVDAKVSSVYKPKGSVEKYSDLTDKEETAVVGDVWDVKETGIMLGLKKEHGMR